LPAALDIPLGGRVQLAATVLPAGATNKNVAWTTSNGNATLSSTTGLAVTVAGAFLGTTAVTVTTADGNRTATCTVTVGRMVSATIAATYHSLTIRADGSLWAWGSNRNGQLGLGDTTDRNTSVRVGAANDWAIVSANGLTDGHSLAIRADGSLWVWGHNGYGQLGLGDTTDRDTPIRVGADADWVAVSTGISHHTMAIKADGSLWAWGENRVGALGLGDSGPMTARSAPVRVGAESDWAAVSVSRDSSVAIKANGQLWAWGFNGYGQLGLGDNTDRNVPVRVGADSDWAAVSGGLYHTLALKGDGSLWAWGDNQIGQLGLDDNIHRYVPVRVGAESDWVAVSAGYGCSFAIKTDGSLWAWGNNSNRDGTNTERRTPVRVGADSDWAAVSAGINHTLALKGDGSLWGWGADSFRFGLGNTAPQNYAVPTLIGSGFCTSAD
jgi:alpha-tubulin suppressor-like RCC1 family protein